MWITKRIREKKEEKKRKRGERACLPNLRLDE
jgi:hypothetical protein